MNEVSVRQFAEATGLKERDVMYRIKKAKNTRIQARKIGWVWVIPESEIERVKSELANKRKRKA